MFEFIKELSIIWSLLSDDTQKNLSKFIAEIK
jgi:hypothetical protein